MANRFYNPVNTKKYSAYDLQIEKKTNVVLLNTLEGLLAAKGDVNQFKTQYKSTYKLIMEDRLSSDAIPLMQELLRALENPVNREAFLKSPLIEDFAKCIFKGHTGPDNHNEWEKYEKDPNSRTRITGLSIYSKVIKCYYTNKDPNTNEPIPESKDTPIGLNFIPILQTFVKTDSKGAFMRFERNIDEATRRELRDAAQLQINNFKSKPLFSENFKYNPEAEVEDESESE